METQEVQSLVEDLDGNIDDLEQALAPILKTALSASTSKLPLLDKAKLYVLATYAIESVLFSALRLNGVDAKSHPVFQELNRVKEYFAKIKNTETVGAKRSTTVDKEAAGRFIKHGLAGNERYDRERAERAKRESAGAKRKFEDMHERVGSHIRFEDTAKRIKADDDAGDVESAQSKATSPETEEMDKKEAKKRRRQERRLAQGGDQAAQAEGESVNRSADAIGDSDGVERAARAPKAQDEVFRELLEGPIRPADEQKAKRKRRRNRGQMMQNLEDKRAEEML